MSYVTARLPLVSLHAGWVEEGWFPEIQTGTQPWTLKYSHYTLEMRIMGSATGKRVCPNIQHSLFQHVCFPVT